MAELGAVAVLPGALGFTGRFNLVSVAVAFVVGWLSAGLLVGVLYRAFSPRPLAAGPLALGAALTGSFLSGMSLTWLFLLRFGVDVGVAFGGSDLLGTVVVAAVFLYLVQVVLLGGYVLTLAVAGRTGPGNRGTASLQPPAAGVAQLQPRVGADLDGDRPARGSGRDPALHLLGQLVRAVAARTRGILEGRGQLAGAVEEIHGRPGRTAEDHQPVPFFVQGTGDAAPAASVKTGHRPAGARGDVEA
jgi:hypothetical protein